MEDILVEIGEIIFNKVYKNGEKNGIFRINIEDNEYIDILIDSISENPNVISICICTIKQGDDYRKLIDKYYQLIDTLYENIYEYIRKNNLNFKINIDDIYKYGKGLW